MSILLDCINVRDVGLWLGRSAGKKSVEGRSLSMRKTLGGILSTSRHAITLIFFSDEALSNNTHACSFLKP